MDTQGSLLHKTRYVMLRVSFWVFDIMLDIFGPVYGLFVSLTVFYCVFWWFYINHVMGSFVSVVGYLGSILLLSCLVISSLYLFLVVCCLFLGVTQYVCPGYFALCGLFVTAFIILKLFLLVWSLSFQARHLTHSVILACYYQSSKWIHNAALPYILSDSDITRCPLSVSHPYALSVSHIVLAAIALCMEATRLVKMSVWVIPPYDLKREQSLDHFYKAIYIEVRWLIWVLWRICMHEHNTHPGSISCRSDEFSEATSFRMSVGTEKLEMLHSVNSVPDTHTHTHKPIFAECLSHTLGSERKGEILALNWCLGVLLGQ